MTLDILRASGISIDKFNLMKSSDNYKFFVRILILNWWYSRGLISAEQKFHQSIKEAHYQYERSTKGIGND